MKMERHAKATYYLDYLVVNNDQELQSADNHSNSQATVKGTTRTEHHAKGDTSTPLTEKAKPSQRRKSFDADDDVFGSRPESSSAQSIVSYDEEPSVIGKHKQTRTTARSPSSTNCRMLSGDGESPAQSVVEYETEPKGCHAKQTLREGLQLQSILDYRNEPRVLGPLHKNGRNNAADSSSAGQDVPNQAVDESNSSDVTSSGYASDASSDTDAVQRCDELVRRWYFKPRLFEMYVVEILHTTPHNEDSATALDQHQPAENDVNETDDDVSVMAAQEFRRCYGFRHDSDDEAEDSTSDINNQPLTSTSKVTQKSASYCCCCCGESVSVAFKMAAQGGRNPNWKGGYICEPCLYCVHNKKRRRHHRH
jgi:hypothetical protein